MGSETPLAQTSTGHWSVCAVADLWSPSSLLSARPAPATCPGTHLVTVGGTLMQDQPYPIYNASCVMNLAQGGGSRYYPQIMQFGS